MGPPLFRDTQVGFRLLLATGDSLGCFPYMGYNYGHPPLACSGDNGDQEHAEEEGEAFAQGFAAGVGVARKLVQKVGSSNPASGVGCD